MLISREFRFSYVEKYITWNGNIKNGDRALADVPKWIGRRPVEPKGGWFDSQSGHMPGLQARYPIGGAQEAVTH